LRERGREGGREKQQRKHSSDVKSLGVNAKEMSRGVPLEIWNTSVGLAEQSLRRDAFGDAALSQQAYSLGVVGNWAAARALLASAMLLRCIATWP
jgi:hypothetical protein